ncbi:hypothetical protein [Runella zeae]|uniref:hypothetical protein n=1 Tax=Runella zeae TaxID=94255 RepID=UPI0004274A32|nr:hypothetical protein [Runella zeae]
MTLIVAHRKNGDITLSSDSRICFGLDDECFDFGIKIFSFDVIIRNGGIGYLVDGRIENYIHPSIPNIDEFRKYSLGIGVAGSAVFAYTIKEFISSKLNILFPMGDHSDLSMVGVMELIRHSYQFVTVELRNVLGSRAKSNFVVTGYCHVEQKQRAFCFYIEEPNVGRAKFLYKEILQKDGTECFGSGKDIAEEILKAKQGIKPLRLVREVIESKKDPRVGGGVQHGGFLKEGKCFSVLGVYDIEHTPLATDDNEFSPVFERANPIHLDPLQYPFIRTGGTYVGLDHE